MSGPEHLSITLKSLLSSLGRTVPACDPQDVHATAELKKKFGELQATLEREAQPHMAEICGAAARLVEELSVNGLVGPKETMDVVARIVASMRGSLGVASDDDGAHGGAGLRLIDGQRLGELLVTLSMLSPDHVERALQLQKTSGMLLGEALVEQGVLTKESVQAALRLQEARRRREGQGGDFESWRSSRAS
jgi:hypothetical protein